MEIHRQWLAFQTDNQGLGQNKTGGLVIRNSREESKWVSQNVPGE